jgi:hypothetical protein
VADASLTNVFRDPRGRDQENYGTLAKAVEELESDKWRSRDYYGALRGALERAIMLLPDKKGPREYSALSWREIAYTLYGFQNVEEADQVNTKKPYNRRYEIIKRRSYTSESTFKAKVISPCFGMLADNLVSLKQVIDERPVIRELVTLNEIGLERLERVALDLPIVLDAARLVAPNLTRPHDLVMRLFDTLLLQGGFIRGQRQREAASELFGHDDSTYSLSLPERRQAAADRYGQQTDVFCNEQRGGREMPLIRAVGTAIEEITAATRSLRAVTSGHAVDMPYIGRPELETKILGPLERGERRVYVVGDAGTGKSRTTRHLAPQLAQRLAGDTGRFVEIGGVSSDRAFADMSDVLQRYGIPVQGLADRDIERLFVDLLSRPEQAPAVVLLDNADGYGVPSKLMLRDLMSVVLVTMRTRPREVASNCVIVPNLESDQAIDMVKSRLPEITDQDAVLLAQTLDGRPLAVEHSCAYLSEHGMPVDMFCAAVRRNAALALDGLAGPDEPTLTAIYQMVLEHIILNTSAMPLLELVLSWPQSSVDLQIAELVLDGILTKPYAGLKRAKPTLGKFYRLSPAGTTAVEPAADQSVPHPWGLSLSNVQNPVPLGDAVDRALARISLQKAVCVLRDLCLVDVDDDGLLTMHALTRDILKCLRSEPSSEISLEGSYLRVFGNPDVEFSQARIVGLTPYLIPPLQSADGPVWLTGMEFFQFLNVLGRIVRAQLEAGGLSPEVRALGQWAEREAIIRRVQITDMPSFSEPKSSATSEPFVLASEYIAARMAEMDRTLAHMRENLGPSGSSSSGKQA